MRTSEVVVDFLILLVIIIVLGIAIVRPYFEAKTFNECTGGDATYVDAAFAELRVQDCKRGD
jgi:hypothetical protein